MVVLLYRFEWVRQEVLVLVVLLSGMLLLGLMIVLQGDYQVVQWIVLGVLLLLLSVLMNDEFWCILMQEVVEQVSVKLVLWLGLLSDIQVFILVVLLRFLRQQWLESVFIECDMMFICVVLVCVRIVFIFCCSRLVVMVLDLKLLYDQLNSCVLVQLFCLKWFIIGFQMELFELKLCMNSIGCCIGVVRVWVDSLDGVWVRVLQFVSSVVESGNRMKCLEKVRKGIVICLV